MGFIGRKLVQHPIPDMWWTLDKLLPVLWVILGLSIRIISRDIHFLEIWWELEFPATCLRNLQTSLCNVKTGSGPIHTKRKRKGKRSKNKRNISKKKSNIKENIRFRVRFLSVWMGLYLSGCVDGTTAWSLCIEEDCKRDTIYFFDNRSYKHWFNFKMVLKDWWRWNCSLLEISLRQERLFSSETHHFDPLVFVSFFGRKLRVLQKYL